MKLTENVEWRVTQDSICFVNTKSNKVFSGNESVRMIFEELLSGTESCDEVVRSLISKYELDSKEYERMYDDVSETILFLQAEGIFE